LDHVAINAMDEVIVAIDSVVGSASDHVGTMEPLHNPGPLKAALAGDLAARFRAADEPEPPALLVGIVDRTRAEEVS
jgi:hypothetical protein